MRSILLFLLCLPFVVNAQQAYDPFRAGDTLIFHGTSNTYVTIALSPIGIEGTDTLYSQGNNISQNINCEGDSSAAYGYIKPYSIPWSGGLVHKNAIGEVQVRNAAGGIITFVPATPLGSSWVLYNDGSTRIKATVSQLDTIRVADILDSAKTIQLQAVDALGDPIVHPVNGVEFLLSKQHGFFSTAVWRDFPSNLFTPGIYSRANTPLLYRYMIYDYDAGDIFQTQTALYIGASPSYEYYQYEILSRFDEPGLDRVSYQVEVSRLDIAYDLDTVSWQFDRLSSLVYRALPLQTSFYSERVDSVEFPVSYSYHAADPFGFNKPYAIGTYSSFAYLSDSCFEIPPTLAYTDYYEIQGMPPLSFRQPIGPFFNARTISYYEKDGEVWGDKFVGLTEPVIGELEVYPNPATHALQIAVNGEASLYVYDMNGRQLLAVPLSQGTNTVQLNELAAGCYLLRVQQANQILQTKLIKQ